MLTAFGEFLQAHHLDSIAQKHGNSTWTTEHSWLAMRDGWCASTNTPLKSKVTDETRDNVLRVGAIECLMRNDLWYMDRLSTRVEILDRSKAISLVKLFTYPQASWLVIQVSDNQISPRNIIRYLLA